MTLSAKFPQSQPTIKIPFAPFHRIFQRLGLPELAEGESWEWLILVDGLLILSSHSLLVGFSK
jgi:hypothetical protein